MTDKILLDRCIQDAGGDYYEVITNALIDVEPIGACRMCWETSTVYEWDVTTNPCPHCGANAVVSVLKLDGVM